MKAQTRFMSMVESWTNIAVGIGLQTLANAIFIPLLFVGVEMKARPLFWLVVIMTVLSNARSYVLRRVFEFIRTRNTPPDFEDIIAEIAAERLRQIHGEGYTPDFDDEWADGELAQGAAAYAYSASLLGSTPFGKTRAVKSAHLWPFTSPFKPTRPYRDLIKAAAMIVAELGRLKRLRKARRP